MDISLIDTSIILEPFTSYQKDKKNYKEAALTLLRYSKRKIIPAISISILGELEFIINFKESLKKELEDKKDKMKEIIDNFIQDCEMIELNKDAIDLASKILNEDYLLDPLDVLHFAIAIKSKCNSFIFMDNKLENSKIVNQIAKEHNLKLESFNIPANEDKGKLRGELIWIED
jgi:predicted nucleic acid-binding protein